MKAGLNKMDIRKYHRMLTEEVPMKTIARRLHTTIKVLNRFTPAKVERAEEARLKAEEKAKAQKDENIKKASFMAEAAAQIMARD